MSDKKWSLPMRIYHWSNALVIFLLFITVVLKKSILNTIDVKIIIKNFFKQINLQIDDEQILDLSREISQITWNWHYYFGFALGILLVIRLLLFFTKSGQSSVKDAFSFLKPVRIDNYWIQLLYLMVYLAIIIMVSSGLTMYFKVELNISQETFQSIESIHVGVMNVIIYFIPLHIIGVVLAENEDQAGITSDMINGGKQ